MEIVEARLASRSRVAVAVVCAAVMAGLVGLAGAKDAEAGAYHVYSCRTPAGAVAPADGWSGSVAAGGAYDDYALNTCASGGALIAALGDITKHAVFTDKALWRFTAPAGEKIANATLWRAGDNGGGGVVNATYQFWLAGPTESNIFAECLYTLNCTEVGQRAQPLSEANRLVVPSDHLGSDLYLIASCGGYSGNECQAGKGDEHGYAAAVYLYAADIVLEQTAGPHASNVTGELTTAPTVQGTSDVAFDASDPGSGVHEAVFSVDGRVVQRSVVDDDNGRCKDVGGPSDGKPAFLYVQPCKPSVSVDVPFDTTRATNGAHRLVVSVIDAAGNSAPVLDRRINIANPPPPGAPNGTNASSQARLSASWVGAKKARIASAYGRRHTIAGRLTGPGGTAIAGARIDCTVTPAYAGAKPVRMACPTTGPDGRFTLKVPRGASSRTVKLAYREHIGEALPVASRTLGLTVRAAVRLRVSPHTTSAGHSIHLTGAVLGGPIPHGGKQLVLEARSPSGRWIEFDVLETDRKGRFHDSYRFKHPGPVDYGFRAVSKSEADFPFATGASNTVRVHER
jgi:hypothetical protein